MAPETTADQHAGAQELASAAGLAGKRAVPGTPALPLGSTCGRLSHREWLALALGALTLTVVVCVWQPDILGTTDWVRMHSLYKAYIRSSVADGRWPLWNPYHWLGRPFLADIETAFFYPPEALFLFLDATIALPITCALHFFLCLYGSLKLARALGADPATSLLVALVMGLGVPLDGCFTSGLIHYGQALCYVPLVLTLGVRLQARADRRSVALLALVLGLQILCGHPQAAWITQVGLVVFLAGRRLGRPLLASLRGFGRDLAATLVASGLGVGLAGVAVLPLAELASQGNRPSASPTFAAWLSEPLAGWATLLVPTSIPEFHFQANAQLYIGLIPLLSGLGGLLRLRNRNARALLVLAVFSALVAAGDSTPAFRVFFHTIPGFGWLRIHSRMTFLVATSLVFAAGIFLAHDQRVKRRELLGLVFAALAAGVIAAAFCLTWPGFQATATAAALLRAGAVVVAAALLAAWMLSRWGRRSRGSLVVMGLVFAAVGVDLLWALHALKQQNRASGAVKAEAGVRHVLEDRGLLGPGMPPPRVFIPSLRENAGMVYGWSTPYGYSALAPGRVWKYMHEVLGVAGPIDANTFPSPVLAAYGPFPYTAMSLVAGADPVSRRLVLNLREDPRAYLATTARTVSGADEAIRLMREGHDFRGVPLVEQPLTLPGQVPASEGKAVITSFAPELIVVATESAAPALLVVAETWFPGWTATVNGAASSCMVVNAWMRGILLPAGKNQVVLSFHSTYLARGAVLSLLSLLVIVALTLTSRKTRD